jgi:nucleotide-binding universal stress UspA family protein
MKKTPIRISDDAVEKILADAERHARNTGVKNVRTDAQSGPVAQTIVDFAKRQRVDLIVMGSRGLGDVEGLLFGSVSHKGESLANCNVMTVR